MVFAGVQIWFIVATPSALAADVRDYEECSLASTVLVRTDSLQGQGLCVAALVSPR